MANNSTPLEQLKSFLNELFQFESQDLDFGIYKILHYKKKEIANFIDSLLVDKVKEQLQTLSEDENEQISKQVKELEKDDIIKGWLKAQGDEKKTLEKFGKEKIKQYKNLKSKSSEASVSKETENQIYNHLTIFFSRYYDKGDFISKRRFGKNEKYVVPYNGEETHFHWANQDQYYIKSSETFQQFAFKIAAPDKTMIVRFKLTVAEVEQGNVKADETNYFIFAENASIINDTEATFYFEYRPLYEEEKKIIKGANKQNVIDNITFYKIKELYGKNIDLAELWKKESEEEPLLLRKLKNYTRKNKYDFFIHKNLNNYLKKELDFYIKSELVDVNDFLILNTEAHADLLKHGVNSIRVFKSLAETIIDFVSQIEDFQKKLWKKKNFIIETQWIITLDRLVKYIGADKAKEIAVKVINNEKQIKEWEQLFGSKNIPKRKLKIEDLKINPDTWKKYPIDTKFFDFSFKSHLINLLSASIDIEKELNGIVFNSDNYHVLNLIKAKFFKKITGVYIDPPYNTGSDDFLYKDGFKHSSWNTALADRLILSKDLLGNGKALFISIDDRELHNLIQVSKSIYGQDSIVSTLIWKKTDSPNEKDSAISTYHEYIICLSPDGKSKVKIFGFIKPEILDAYPKTNDDGKKYRLRQLRKNGKAAKRKDRPNLFYPLTAPDGTTVYPIAPEGWEGRWVKKLTTVEKLIKKDEITWVEREYGWVPYYIEWAPEIPMSPYPTLVDDVDQNRQGKAEYTSIFPDIPFDTPKPTSLVLRILDIISFEDKNSIFLDYYAGSGTTAHATLLKNKLDDGNRKFILSELEQYVTTLILPRLKKIAYTYDWEKGNPQDESMNGPGIFFKYQKLEQYEETLENISFNASENALQKTLEFDQYIPKYFLNFETKESNTLVNISAMKDPWNYNLKIWDGFNYDTEQAVDLVETFNYLIGLHMQKHFTKELKNNRYDFIFGSDNNNKKIAVVWRSVKGWDLDDYKADSIVIKKELESFKYDKLYINDQAHIKGYEPIEEVFKNKMLS